MRSWPLHLASLAILTASVAIAQSTGTITGVVTDGATGKPLAGALVTASSPAAPAPLTTVTDAAGAFTLPGLPPGAWRLSAQLEGYKPAERADLALGENVTLRASLAVVPEAVQLEEVVVTGSRLRRKDLNTPAPVAVVTREQIQASGKFSIGDFLQSLPEQGNAWNAQVNNGGANANTDGSVRINLRNLDMKRTLVLVNGRRFVAGGLGADAAVDLNSIPDGAVERVEVLKDGASAVYGSDAVAGVVNIITRKTFNGTEATATGGTSGHSDAQTTTVQVTTGRSNADGGFLFSAGYAQQWSSWLRNRSWSRFPLTYDYGTHQANFFGSYAVPAGDMSLPTAPNGVDPTPECLANALCAGLVNAYPTWASEVFVRDPGASLGWRPITDADTYNYSQENYLTTPSTRVQAYASGDARLGSLGQGYYEASYVQRTSRQNAAPMPLYPGDYGISVSKDSLYNPFGVDLPFVGRRLIEFGRREYSQELTTFRVVTGLKGALPDAAGPLAGWAWDASFNYGRTSGTFESAGAIRNSRVADAVGPSMLDGDGHPVCVRTAGDLATVIPGCVPLNLFGGPGSIQPDQIQGLGYTGTSRALDSMVAAQLDVSGDLFRLRADRPVGLAVGYEYRTERGAQIPDPIAESNDSADANFKATAGSFQVHEAYAELSIPIVGGLPWVEDLEVDLAGRLVDYDTFGTNFSYKAGLRWTPVRDVTLRGTVSTAFRAPSVAELFLGHTQGFPSASDPCASLAGAPQALVDQCVAQGVPPGGSNDPRNQIISILGGNKDLRPETANIFTAGVVLEPRALPGFSATVDYYNVFVNHAIGTFGVPGTLAACFPGADGTQDPAACALIRRDANGRILDVADPARNNFWDQTAGVDLSMRWAGATPAGQLGLRLDGTWLAFFDRKLPTGRVVHGAGNYDIMALPRVKANLGATWERAGWGAGAGVRYIGSFKECAAPDGTSAGGLCYDGNPGSRQVGSNVTADVHGQYQLSSGAGKTSLLVGVNNVFDQKPQYVYAAVLANSDPTLYDYVGRFYYVRLQHAL